MLDIKQYEQELMVELDRVKQLYRQIHGKDLNLKVWVEPMIRVHFSYDQMSGWGPTVNARNLKRMSPQAVLRKIIGWMKLGSGWNISQRYHAAQLALRHLKAGAPLARNQNTVEQALITTDPLEHWARPVLARKLERIQQELKVHYP